MILGKLVEALRVCLYDPLAAIPRQKVQFEFSIGRLDVVLDSLPLVGRQTVDQYQGLPATMHQDLAHLDEQSGVHPSLVGREQKAASGIDGGSRRDRLSLPGHAYDRGLSPRAPSRSLHYIGAKPGFIPEINLGASLFRPLCKARIGVTLPCFNCSRIAFVSALQRLLWRQS